MQTWNSSPWHEWKKHLMYEVPFVIVIISKHWSNTIMIKYWKLIMFHTQPWPTTPTLTRIPFFSANFKQHVSYATPYQPSNIETPTSRRMVFRTCIFRVLHCSIVNWFLHYAVSPRHSCRVLMMLCLKLCKHQWGENPTDFPCKSQRSLLEEGFWKAWQGTSFRGEIGRFLSLEKKHVNGYMEKSIHTTWKVDG